MPPTRLAAIRQLGDMGDFGACPALSLCLHDAEAAVADAAEEAMWSVFMR